MPKNKSGKLARLAFRFVLIIGIANFFADMTYEGARSIIGPFLGSLGASATIVGIVAGFGEFLGYGLRSVSGYYADRTHRYWLFVFLGYAVNLFAIPALAFAGSWPVAAALIIAERTGRAIRRPSVEAMISYTGKEIGSGWVFGLNEALDQAGATIGPLILAFILSSRKDYRSGFGVFIIPALLCLATLVVARVWYPRPHELERKSAGFLGSGGFSKAYWIYTAAGALIAAGFADFSLIAFHFQRVASVSQETIPIFYAVAMGAGALTTLLFGILLDRIGFPIIVIAFFLGSLFAPLVFLGHFWLALLGTGLWGIGMGAQDSLLKAILTNVVVPARRSTAFGLFDTGYGIAWFLGSATMGFLYDKSLTTLIVFSVVLQLSALPILFWARIESKNRPL